MNYAYGWSDSTVAFMANWGTIMFVVAVVPLSLMLEKRYAHCKLNSTTCNRAFININVIVTIGNTYTTHVTIHVYVAEACGKQPYLSLS